jgi:hypothetical protein
MRTAILCSVLFYGAVAFGSDHWQWVRAENTTQGWIISQGDADVVISGEHFKATLFAGSGKETVSSLEGTIHNGKITVIETAPSDFTGSKYNGTLVQKNWPEFAGTTGAASITLSDKWDMIGIRKNMQK